MELDQSKKVDSRKYIDIFQNVQNILRKRDYEQNRRQLSKQLKEVGVDIVNFQDSEGYSSLHISSFYGDFKIVEYLLNQGGDKNLKSRDGKTVMDLAQDKNTRKYLGSLNSCVNRSDGKELKTLISTGLNIDQKDNIFGRTPMHSAAQKQHTLQMLQQILTYNAAVDIQDSNGYTSLHLACQNGHLDTVILLLKNNADIYKKTNKLYQPIHLASLNNHSHIIPLLLSYVKPPTQQYLELYLNSPSYNNLTSIQLASKKGHFNAVEILIKLGADIYSQDSFLQTSLHHAVFNNHIKIIQLLLTNDSDYEKLRKIKNSQGKLPKDISNSAQSRQAFNNLWYCASIGDIDSVSNQLNQGMNINEKTKLKQNTALILATINNQLLIVKFLLDNRCDKTLRNKEGKQAIDYAYKSNNIKIIQLLEDFQTF